MGSRPNIYIISLHWGHNTIPWWRHQMETFSALLAPCAGNSLVGAKPSSELMTEYCDKLQWNLQRHSHIFNRKMHLKMSSAKWWQFRLVFNVLSCHRCRVRMLLTEPPVTMRIESSIFRPISLHKQNINGCQSTATEMLSFWWNCCYWLHWKL